MRLAADLALLALAASLVLRLAVPAPLHPHSRILAAARLVSTLGALVMLLHVALAFHFVHHWSHAEAVAHTARVTHAKLGYPVGFGVWFNYLFVALWAADVAWSWIAPRAYARRPRLVTILLFGYLAFIAFQSTVVFETGLVRLAGAALTLLLLVVWAARRFIFPASRSFL